MNSNTEYRLLRINIASNIITELDRWNLPGWQHVVSEFITTLQANKIYKLSNLDCSISEWQKNAIQNPVDFIQKINMTQYGKYRYLFTRDSELLDFLFEVGKLNPYSFI